jgi:transcriptional regulator with XRE-family HTH domain
LRDDPVKLFGLRLRALRKRHGWSQEDLAIEAGLDRTYVSSIERGKRNISLINILKLSEALGVSPGTLLEFDVNTESA